MARLAMNGGKPVVKNLIDKNSFGRRRDLEKKYLLKAYDEELWDDWPTDMHKNKTAARAKEAWARFTGSKYCGLYTNGTHTLQIALESLGIGVSDEVIVPGLTWQATASAVCDVNARPVLVDIDPETLCIDPARIAEAITPRTRAIIPVHLYHRMADMDRIKKLAKKHNLFIIEDCAHTHGSEYKGKGAGTIGDFGSFSFQRSKLVTCGEGGGLLTQKQELFYLSESQRMCGREVIPGYKRHSGNFRITAFQAGILLGQLAWYRRIASRIDANGLTLDRAVADAPGVRPLKRSSKITRQCSYCYGFLYDKDAFDGLECSTFRKALSAETGINWMPTYEPLNKSPYYYPHTKKRHRLSKAYLASITPSQFALPEAEKAHRDRAVLADWGLLATRPLRARYLTEAIAKIYANRHELER